MALVTLPALTLLFDDVSWLPVFPQQKNRSGFTGRSQVVGQPGCESWEATAHALPVSSIAEAEAWRRFFAAIRGSENTFHLPALTRPQRAVTQPTVTAAVTGNRAVTVSSAANVSPGMYATVEQNNGHFRLVTVVAIAGSNVHFEPALTGAPKTGQPLLINNPYCPVRMADPRQRIPNFHQPFSFDVEEAL